MLHRILLPLLVAICALAACGDSVTEPTPGTTQLPDSGLYTVRGKLAFKKGIAVPADARVLVLWSVSSGSPDSVYVFGEGWVNMADSTFRISFRDIPPDGALNQGTLGVGGIILTTNHDITPGKYGAEADRMFSTGFLGGAADYAVIYTRPNPTWRDWARSFPLGFSMGIGVRKQTGFDEFAPTGPTGVIIEVNDLNKIDWVNWT